MRAFWLQWLCHPACLVAVCPTAAAACFSTSRPPCFPAFFAILSFCAFLHGLLCRFVLHWVIFNCWTSSRLSSTLFVLWASLSDLFRVSTTHDFQKCQLSLDSSLFQTNSSISCIVSLFGCLPKPSVSAWPKQDSIFYPHAPIVCHSSPEWMALPVPALPAWRGLTNLHIRPHCCSLVS